MNEKDQRSVQENWRYQGNISCKIGTTKDRNNKNLTEVEGIKKRWQEYTEELYKKDLNDSDNHDGVVTHPEWSLHFLRKTRDLFKKIRDPRECFMQRWVQYGIEMVWT